MSTALIRLLLALLFSSSALAAGAPLPIGGSIRNGEVKLGIPGSINSNYFVHTLPIATIGDSISSANLWQVKLLSLLGGAPWSIYLSAVSGDTTARMLARSPGEVGTVPDLSYAIYFAGINDVVGSKTTNEIETNLQTMYNQAKSIGAKVVAVTITPFKGNVGWTDAKQAVLTNVNLWILNAATNIDYRINAYTNLVDPSNADTLLPAYASIDWLHLLSPGHDALASNIFSGVTWTLSTNESTLSLSGASTIYLNQSLRANDAPTFKGLHVGAKLLDATGAYPMSLGIGTNSPTDGQFVDFGFPMRTVDLTSSTTITAPTFAGNLTPSKTVTATGVTGGQTINKTAGRVNFDVGATSLVVSNSFVTSSSLIFLTPATHDSTARDISYQAATGYFTIYFLTAPSAQTSVSFLVIN
jgi:lysophospholipase L1-like esterase